ncbi:AAA family ATPase [Rathayibacter sp. AY1D2]|uniref:AAA family ATPase n=1 Tax=Rathayibacter sp. AY1D2 TaxID=2080543 RepID=UPI0015E29DCC|nr:AAA family ATPase [Rathayibacter sp. AY1D2]
MPDLRLRELVVENFRSISGRCVVPLDGSITLVHGANGAGKTSLLSAIELAATGRVGFLEEQKGDTRSLLLNQDFSLGSVRLSLIDQQNVSRVGSFELDRDHVTGEAALTPAEQTYFLERSFLPQTALGRLLESYTESGKQVDTALVRFVKSLVGLDDLDALIDGLHAAGDVRRSKRLIYAWNRSADDLQALKDRRKEIVSRLSVARADFDAAVATLRDLVGDPASTDVSELLRASTEQSRASETDRAGLARLAELQATVDAIANMRLRSIAVHSSRTDQFEALRAEKAQYAFEAWESGIGAIALAELNRMREISLGLPAVTIRHIADAFAEAVERAARLDQQHTNALVANRERAVRVAGLDQRIRELDEAINTLEEDARGIEVSQDVRILIQILELAVPITRTDRCPICDEHFTGSGSLVDHFAEKLDRLSVDASRIVTIQRELTKLQKERLASSGQAVLEKSLPTLSSGSSMDQLIRDLNGMADVVAEGSELRRDLQSTQASIAEANAHAAERAIIADRATAVAKELDIAFKSLSAQEPDVKLGQEIAKRVQAIRNSNIRQLRERKAREAIEDAQREVRRWEHELTKAEQEMAALKAQLLTAESRMVGSRQVLQTAERTRSKLINEVFDQSLNSLWAQLFSRFAPSERFTPRFVKQTQASRSVDVSLETELPGGKASGSPGAMLSYGNTNSAALALFMALHLSAPSELRWLVFDDPVQSMDDIHVANFAAIVRQLAFVHDRQVIIAIHQPELFDYLSLALAPSHPAQSLVRITLDRGTGTTVADIDRVEYVDEPSLRQAN